MGRERSSTRERSVELVKRIVKPAAAGTDIELLHFLNPATPVSDEEPIRQRMRRYLEEADCCIADLTDHNPNVCFEYGMRRRSGRPVLPIIQQGKRLDFDVDDYVTTFYDLDEPGDAIAHVRNFFCESGTFRPDRTLVASERIAQTRPICDYIESRHPERIDVVHFSLLTLRTELFQALRRSPETKVRLLLLDPSRAAQYGLQGAHAENVLATAREVRILPDTTRHYGEPCPTVGLWYYDHEPGIAAMMIDEEMVQLGWYLRDHSGSPDRELRVYGHNQPGFLLSGAAAHRVLPKLRAHFVSVLASARLANEEWGIVGPNRGELIAEWQRIRSTGAVVQNPST